jgi:hypothetical protein
MHKPEKLIKDRINHLYGENKNLVVDVFQKADAWILWFIGFAIGGLALLAGNLDKFHDRLTPAQVHNIFIALFYSIVSGIVFRYFYIWFYIHLVKNVYGRLLYDFNSEFDLPSFRPLTGNETFEELIILLNNATGESFESLLPTFANLDGEKRVELCLTLINYYNQTRNFYEQEITKGSNLVKERLEVYFAKPIEEHSKQDNSFNRLFGLKYYLFVALGSLLFLTFLGSFGTAVYIFCFNIHI